MAITSFIPSVWAEALTRSLNKEYIGVAHCNRDFEGEIKNCGSSVKVCHVKGIEIYEYDKHLQLMDPQALENKVSALTVDRARYFNFLIDDIDRVQKSPKLMASAMQAAAHALANEADSYVFSLYYKASKTCNCINATPETILEPIYRARTYLLENGVSDLSQVVFEVSPAVANLILQSKMLISHDNTAVLETGSLGTLLGFPVFVSNNLFQLPENNNTVSHMCLLRTKRAISFAEQLSQIEAYRPNNRFADAVKGLQLYGAEVICPEEMVCINYSVANTD